MQFGRRSGRLDAGMLDDVRILRGLAPVDVVELVGRGHWRLHKAGDQILTLGDTDVHVVVAGMVRLYLRAVNDQEVTTNLLLAGDVLDSGRLRSPCHDVLRAQALDRVIIFTFPRTFFHAFAVTHPSVQRLLTQQAYDHWCELSLFYLDRALNRRAGLVAHMVDKMSRAGGTRTVPITRAALARFLGMSRAQCLRDLALLERRGFIQIEQGRGGITVLDPRSLAGFADLTGEV